MTDLLSIVIPVYNQELYLNQCLESLVNQDYKDVEIILIDDGSIDSSSLICDQWQEKDNRVRAIHTENKGVAEARNLGIRKAIGKYITFVDPDDYVDTKVYVQNLSLFDESVDYIQYPYKEFPLPSRLFSPEPITCHTEEDLLSQILHMQVNYTVTNKIFRTDLIRDLQFRRNYYEDMEFLIEVFKCSYRFRILDKGCYYYRRHDGSVTASGMTEQKDKDHYSALIARGSFVSERIHLDRYSTPLYVYWFMISFFRDIEARQYRDSKYDTLRETFIKMSNMSIVDLIRSGLTIHQKTILLYYKLFGLDSTINRLCHK